MEDVINSSDTFTISTTYESHMGVPSTGAYLTDIHSSEGTRLEFLYNQKLLTMPTNPHVARIYHLKINDENLTWAFPASIIRNTNIRQYFQSLLKFQYSNKFIHFKDFTSRKHDFFYSELKKLFLQGTCVPNYNQLLQYLNIIKIISKDINWSVHDFVIKPTAENELAIIRETDDGVNYLIIGEEENDLSFMFISKTPGNYSALHLDNDRNITLEYIIEIFLT